MVNTITWPTLHVPKRLQQLYMHAPRRQVHTTKHMPTTALSGEQCTRAHIHTQIFEYVLYIYIIIRWRSQAACRQCCWSSHKPIKPAKVATALRSHINFQIKTVCVCVGEEGGGMCVCACFCICRVVREHSGARMHAAKPVNTLMSSVLEQKSHSQPVSHKFECANFTSIVPPIMSINNSYTEFYL